MLTADTITDEQIRELRETGPERFTITTRITPMAVQQQSHSLWQLCMDAMKRPDYQPGDARVRLWPHGDARARCAEIWNQRGGAARDHVTDPILTARIREVAHDVLTLIGKLATAKEEVVS